MDGEGARISGILGARMAGTLKDAKIVTLSRRQKRVYEILGICFIGSCCGGGCVTGLVVVVVDGNGDWKNDVAREGEDEVDENFGEGEGEGDGDEDGAGVGGGG